ncbi:MAG: hypothetical protein QJR13_09630, partial [Bacillota bacterium]|nr:hypothetical protein [Bacillota bacterium]
VITREALRGLEELAAFDAVEVTPYTYGELNQSAYGPKFKVVYKFEKIGDRVSAREILAAYASEPDWNMDTDLNLSPLQKLTGGSQGWRHQRYTLLGSLVSLGEGPERAEHFYRLALAAYRKGDFYWAFRFLARSLHYLQDLNHPLHALPLPVSDLVFKYRLNVAEATTVAVNVHSIEGYFAYYLRQGSPSLLQALAGPEVARIDSVSQHAIRSNQAARQRAVELYRLVLAIWPQLETKRKAPIAEAEYACTQPEAELAALWRLMEERLAATAADTRGLVVKFLREAEKSKGELQ